MKKLQPDLLPQDLRDIPSWVCWRLEQREGEKKPDKIPYNPATNERAKSNTPSTWGTIQKSLVSYALRGYDGIGFMFGNGIVGIDIDHCVDENGNLSELAQDVADTINSYMELSPSGTGLHIICRGALPDGARKNGSIGLEMYSEGRFFTVTTQVCGRSFYELPDRTSELAAIHEKYMRKPAPEKKERASQSKQRPESVPEDDDKVIERAQSAKNGHLFENLFNGHWEGRYENQSEGDMALCNLLAFWTRSDAAQMDRIFRRSGLMRDKWDEVHVRGATYGAATITKAIEDALGQYAPGRPRGDDEDPFPPENPKPPLSERPAEEKAQSIELPPEDAAYYLKKAVYTMDDTGNAMRMRDLFGYHVRYSYTHDIWYYWNGRLWQEDISGVLRRMAEFSILRMYDERDEMESAAMKERMDNHIRRSRNTQGKNNMINELKQRVPVLPSEIDAEPMLFSVMNGVVDLHTGELLSHARERFITKVAPVEYDPAAEKPERWIAFIDEIMGHDNDMIRFLQKAIGYSLTGLTTEQCLFVLYGNGANGKSTLLEVMKLLVGDYQMNAQPETVMVKERASGSGASSDVARLAGARIVTTVEPEEGRRLSEGLVKQLTGGDPITCRFLYGKEFEYQPSYKIWLATNHRPIIRGTDNGIWRRIKLVPFSVTIPEERQDKNLVQKLRAELPGILNWALEGLAIWRKEGLGSTKAVAEATTEYRADMDSMMTFIEDKCNVGGEDKWCYIAEIYEAYKDWAEQTGEHPVTMMRFSMKFKERGFDKIKTSKGLIYRGIAVKDPKYRAVAQRVQRDIEYRQYKANGGGHGRYIPKEDSE